MIGEIRRLVKAFVSKRLTYFFLSFWHIIRITRQNLGKGG